MNRKINYANLLSIARIAIVPIFLWTLYGGSTKNEMFLKVWALLLFGLICITDFFDGIVARKFNQVTKIGEWVDLIADFIFLLSTYLVLFVISLAPFWMPAVILIKFIDYIFTSRLLKNVNEKKLFVHDLLGRIVVVLYIVVIGAILVNSLLELEILSQTLLVGIFWFLLFFSLTSSAYRIILALKREKMLKTQVFMD
jgi:CDP-diacylglycerol--glycerol-3-phosphate 3-phosphatidyltransferase